MTYYGLERVRAFNQEDERINDVSFRYIIFGFRALQQNRQIFEGMNKDKVCVFVTSERAYCKARTWGFSRVFMVRSLLGITVDELLEANVLDQQVLDMTAAIIRAAATAGHSEEHVQCIHAVGELVRNLKARDFKKCAALVSRYSEQLENCSDELVDILKNAKHLVNVQKLKSEVTTLKEKLATVERQLPVLNTEISAKVDTTSTKPPEPDSGKVATMQVALEEVARQRDITREELISYQVAEAEKRAQVSMELRNALQKYADLEEQFRTLSAERDSAQANCGAIESKLREQVDEYNALVGKHNLLAGELEGVREQLESANVTIAGYRQSEAELNANTVIIRLKEEIEELGKSNINIDKMNKMLPAIGNKFAISAAKIVVLKEIKTAVYMNSLVRQMNAILRSRVNSEQHKTYCIVVFDMLMDQFRLFKYKKHGFAINKPPIVTAKNDLQVVVTNQLDVSFLKGTLKLNTFDYLVVIDRLKLPVSAVKHSAATEFYLIDSYHDLEDFKIRGGDFIIFGDSNKLTPALSIEPDGHLFDKADSEREYSFYKSRSAEKILELSGVV